ncbi:MAG: hypothetical protein PVJ53_05375 [Desulfobacterales bacterium]|jgi:hypothetical protein
MERFRNLIPLTLVILLGILVQVVLVVADTKETPTKGAVAFTKAFYKMDPAVTERMCGDLLADANPVDDLFHQAVMDAQAKGFSASYPRMQLFHLQAAVLAQDEASAQVRLTCSMKRAIHPAFAYFLKMWNLGETYHLDEVVDLVNEDGQWKVCGYDYAMID